MINKRKLEDIKLGRIQGRIFNDDYDLLINIAREYMRLKERNKELQEVLGFYADYKNYTLSAEAERADLTEFINVIDKDNGYKARKILEEITNE